eukprot:403366566
MGEGISNGVASDIVNGILVTFFVAMALVSHFRCMTTQPGFIPKNYESLEEKNLSKRFQKLITERESIYQSGLVRKLQREGKEQSEAMQIAQEQAQKEIMKKIEETNSMANSQGHLEDAGTIQDKELKSSYLINEQDTQEDQSNSKAIVNREAGSYSINRRSESDNQFTFDKRVFEHGRTSSDMSNRFSISLKVRRNTYVDKIVEKKCYKCNSIKPPTAHHCANCDHCVAYMDHHCPWVNNCVGLYTQKLFVLFNFYSLISIIYAITLNLTHGFDKLRNHSTKYGLNAKIEMNFADFMQVTDSY